MFFSFFWYSLIFSRCFLLASSASLRLVISWFTPMYPAKLLLPSRIGKPLIVNHTFSPFLCEHRISFSVKFSRRAKISARSSFVSVSVSYTHLRAHETRHDL